MLTELRLQNFGIVEAQTISFGRGLNVISGQTGAGKSMVLQAIEMILGGRGGVQYVRQESESLEIEALFSLADLPQEIVESLPDIAQGEELVLSRTIFRNGRNKVRINGNLGTVSLLEEISRGLINICGQREHIRLVEDNYHLEVLDSFGGYKDLILCYRDAYTNWREIKELLLHIVRSQAEIRTEEIDLQARLEDLTKIDLQVGQKESLEQEVRLHKSRELMIGIHQRLLDLFESDGGVMAQLSLASDLSKELCRIDPSFNFLGEGLAEAECGLSNVVKKVSSFIDGRELGDSSIEVVMEKLSEICRLERRYRRDEAGLCLLLSTTKSRLSEIGALEDIDQIKSREEEARGIMERASEELHKAREMAASRLRRDVIKELSELALDGSSFEVEFTPSEPTVSGMERVRFLISTNKGEPVKPLKEVASGGELSRVMLVLKKILKDRTGVNVLVFDEIDSGVSGSVARAVGEKLRSLSSYSQVLCITHLPQVASLADLHLLVEKRSGKRTVAVIRELDEPQKIEEIARMLAGYEVTETARASARELLASKPKDRN